jgi:hypothetical protein
MLVINNQELCIDKCKKKIIMLIKDGVGKEHIKILDCVT